MAEILATLDDINANLPSDAPEPVVVATDENTSLLQISVARVVRGYLSGVLDRVTLASWTTPESTPETVSEVAAKLIAAQLYFNQSAKTSVTIDRDSFAQKLYDEAMAILNQIISGQIIVVDPTTDVVVTTTDSMSDLDYFPTDGSSRPFSINMNL
jgi:hypothetical protein